MNNEIKAVIFDWAGTIVDFGSLCPVVCFQEAFAHKGVELEGWEVHRFMGTHKLHHIQSVLEVPEVTAQWQEMYGRDPDTADRDEIYVTVERLLLEKAGLFAEPVPHYAEAMRAIRARGLKVGSTTGYTEPVMERLVPAARAKGVQVDAWVASDQVKGGRPHPWMIFKNLELLGSYPPNAVVKVGDTLIDMEEAHNAGCWAVGVVDSSSMMGLEESTLQALEPAVREERKASIRSQMQEAGAHFVIDHLGELDSVLSHIAALPPQSVPPFATLS